MRWLRPMPLAALMAPMIGATAPKGLAPLLFALGAWGWLAAWRTGRLADIPAVLRMPVLWPLWGLAAWALVAIAWSPAKWDAAQTWLHLALVVAALPPLLLDVPDDTATARRALVIGFMLMLMLLAFEVASDLALHRIAYEAQGKGREFERTVLNRRIVALLLFAWPAACALALRGKRLLAAGAVLATALVTFGGVSNSAQMAVLLAILSGLAALALPRLLPPVLAAALAASVILSPFPPGDLLSPARWGPALERYYSGLHRLYIWEFARQRIAERPVAGWGLDSSPHLPGGDVKLPEGGNRMNMHPHNGTLQVWIELGGIGAALFGALMVMVALAIRRLGSRHAVALATAQLVAALTVVHLSFGIWQTAWMAGLGLAAVLTVTVCASDVRQPDQA